MTLTRVRTRVKMNPAGGGPSFDKLITASTPVDDRFTGVTAGQRVGLEDGVYTGFKEGTIPNYVALEAVNHGNVTINGGDDSWRAVIYLDGIGKELNGLRIGQPDNTTSHALHVLGSDHIIKNTGCYDGGNYKHKIPLFVAGSGHLIEDCWAWGEGRYTFQAFGANNITFRRCVGRWDETIANEASEPNATFAIYSSYDCTIENCISLDYGTPETAMTYGGDFYAPQHLSSGPDVSGNHWLGNFVINHSASSSNRRAIRFDPDTDSPDNVINDFYVRGNGTAFVIARMPDLSILKATVIDSAMGTYESETIVPTGAAEITKRWVDRVKTDIDLWPWPNEALIKADMSGSDNKRSTDSDDTTWVSSSNLGYSAWIAGSKTLSDYVQGL